LPLPRHGFRVRRRVGQRQILHGHLLVLAAAARLPVQAEQLEPQDPEAQRHQLIEGFHRAVLFLEHHQDLLRQVLRRISL